MLLSEADTFKICTGKLYFIYDFWEIKNYYSIILIALSHGCIMCFFLREEMTKQSGDSISRAVYDDCNNQLRELQRLKNQV